MPTPEEQMKEFERLRAAALRPLSLDGEGKGNVMDPSVREAVESYVPPAEPAVSKSGDGETVNVRLGGALRGATLPFTPGAADSGTSAGKGGRSGEGTGERDYFYDMLVNNEAYRLKNEKDFERRERSNRARTVIAAVSDALSSLGNLVGTTRGAVSQEQTYQTPFITEQVEADRASARKLAQAIDENRQALNLAKMRLDAQQDMQQAVADRQLAVQDALTQRALAQIAGRESLEETKHGYRAEENAQKGEIREGIVRMQNESAERRTGITAGTSRANALTRDAFNREKLEAERNGEIGSGRSTTETYEYDRSGNVTRKSRGSGSGGGNNGKKANPMGNGKKKNPMN